MGERFNDNSFRDDVFDFFDYTRGGHLDRAAYHNPQNWGRIVSASHGAYYLADPVRELSVIQRIADYNNLFVDNGHSVASIFEIGAGTGEKIIPFLDNPSLKHITLIDYEAGLNEEAHDKIRGVNEDIPITLIEQDFQDITSGHPRISGRVLGLVLGGTIANVSSLPDLESMERASRGGKSFLKGALSSRFGSAASFYYDCGELLVTIDTGDEEKSLSAYNGPEHDDFILGALERIPEVLETTLTKEKIRNAFRREAHVVQPFGETRAICHSVVCDNGISFIVEGRRFNLKAGFRNSVINSFKPTELQLIESAKSAGFSHIDTYHDEDGLVAVVHFKWGPRVRSSLPLAKGREGKVTFPNVHEAPPAMVA